MERMKIGKTVFHFTKDLSQSVKIERYTAGNETDPLTLYVPGHHLVKLIAAVVRDRRQVKLASMSVEDLLDAPHISTNGHK